MSYLWHGYVAFQKPAAVEAAAWTAALAALKAELDETPEADSPAERWHSVTNGDTTIAEATFDLSKLNTANLTTVAGVDMTDAWEPLRIGQEWARSLVRAHSLVNDRGWDLGGYTAFLPEDYGTIGNSPTEDTAAVQAAIDAAVAAGGGRVVCNGTYALHQVGTQSSIIGGNLKYALQIDGDNVGIEGSGTFVLDAAETYEFSFIGLIVGNGGSTEGLPGETGTWRYNNWVRGVTFDGSAKNDEYRGIMGGSAIRCLYIQDFDVAGVTTVNGWGGSAQISTHASCRYGSIRECSVGVAVSNYGGDFAFWIDGGRHVLIANNVCASACAVTFQANLDNTDAATGETAGLCMDCQAVGNTFAEMGDPAGRIAVSVTGADNIEIVDNVFTSAEGQYFWGVRVTPYTRATDGTALSDNCVIRGNTFTSALGSNRVFDVLGLTDDLNTEGTDPVYVQGMTFENNTVTGFTRRGYFGNSLVSGLVVAGNTYPAGATTYDYGASADEALIVATNTLQ